MAVDFLKAMKRDPSSVSRQLHGVSIGSNRYFVREVNAAGGIGKTIAGGRLESLLNDIAMRSSSSEAKTTAVRHLAQFDQLSKATSQMSERGASAAALDRVRDHEASAVRKTLRPRTALKTGTLIVSNELEAKGWISRVARSPGVGMAALTFAFDEGFSGWQYYDGSIGSADFQRHTVQNGIKAAAFGSATQLVWILSPTPHGLVLIGVGIVAYVAADYAIGYYEANLESKAPMAYELRGIVDDKIINAPLIEEWATGKVRR